jgi:hypothetical protein
MTTTKTLLTILTTAIFTAVAVYLFIKPNHIFDIPDETRNLNSICMDYDTVSPPTLTSKMVKSMVDKYSATQLNNIQTATSNSVPRDAKSIWFDVETLKQFLYHIEHNVAKNQSSKQNIGVRIYYAAYPKNSEMSLLAQDQSDPNFTMNPSYENLHTLVMIPTISGSDGNNYDFNPLDVNSYNGFAKMNNKNLFDGNTYEMVSLGTAPPQTASSIANINLQTQQVSNAINARNHGILQPPFVATGTSF